MDNAAKARFREFMDSCEFKRHEQLEVDFRMERDFLKLVKEHDELYKQLKESLSENQLEMLKAYEDVIQNIGIQRGIAFYKYGFMDASELIQLLAGGSKNIKLNVQIM